MTRTIPLDRPRGHHHAGQVVGNVLGADHLFAKWREDEYTLALLRAVDVAIRLYGRSPQPSVVAERDED